MIANSVEIDEYVAPQSHWALTDTNSPLSSSRQEFIEFYLKSSSIELKLKMPQFIIRHNHNTIISIIKRISATIIIRMSVRR